MFPPLFAFRSSWVAILGILVVLLLLWFIGRVIKDGVIWFKEEVVEEILEHRDKSKAAKQANKKVEESRADAEEPD